MRRFLCENWRLRKRLTKAKERIVEIIQLLNAATLQQMNKKEKEEKNEKMINVGEESAENVRMKKIIKKFSKKKENSDTMMSEVVDVENSNARILMKHHIDSKVF